MICCLAALLLISFSSSVVQPERLDIEQLIIDRAITHGADPVRVLRIAQCESRLNPYVIGSHGERGVFQWLRRGHWTRTPAYLHEGIDIHTEYIRGNPDAVFFDIDMGVWSFGTEAQRTYPNNYLGWSCR